jgi:hypothetical protein
MMNRQTRHDAIELFVRERQAFGIAVPEHDIGQAGFGAALPRFFQHRLGRIESDNRCRARRQPGGHDARPAGYVQQFPLRRGAERGTETLGRPVIGLVRPFFECRCLPRELARDPLQVDAAVLLHRLNIPASG